MPTLSDHDAQNFDYLWRRFDKASQVELSRAYRRAFASMKASLTALMDIDPADLTRAQRSAFVRQSGIVQQISRTMGDTVVESTEFLQDLSKASVDASFYRSGWAVDNAARVGLQWGSFTPEAVAAAAGLSDNFEALGGLMSAKELRRHRRVMETAYRNYDRGARRTIGRTVSQSIIEGKSIPKIARDLKRSLEVIYSTPATIARTETLRSLSLGSQLAYDQAGDQGVRVKQVWTATLDDRTRPDHAEMDGEVFDEELGGFIAPWGVTPGPHRTGLAEEDINCRCRVRPEVDGFSPEVRRTREGGLEPYQSYRTWAEKQGLDRNRYGQRFNFI